MRASTSVGVTAFAAIVLATACSAQGTNDKISSLSAAYRDGQVFLTWKEGPTPDGTSFNVYMHNQPITAQNLSAAKKIGHHVEQFSATDWLADPTFRTKPADKHVGFVIQTGGKPLDPESGLFVHTVTAGDAGEFYYAVTSSDAAGKEDLAITAGANSLAKPVQQKVAPIQPIWIGQSAPPAAGSGKGKRLSFHLHGLGSDRSALSSKDQGPNALVFGDASQGWREGIARKMTIKVAGDRIQLEPLDRLWIYRAPTDAPDERYRYRAVSSWWYGCSENVYDPAGKITPAPYTANHLLWLMDWARQTLGCDGPVSITGNSMGGTGAVALAMHYPERLAVVSAEVPLFAYENKGQERMINLMGKAIDENTLDVQGRKFLQYMSATEQVKAAKVDLPYLHTINGRTDQSMPRANCPPFYKAIDAARQAYSCYWNDGGHESAIKNLPPDVKAWMDDQKTLARFKNNQSYPAFSNNSSNKNPGNGSPTDGDIEGWMNRGMDWSVVADEPGQYSIKISANYPGIVYPVTVDMTPRRVQAFKPAPGTKLKVMIDGAPAADVTVAPMGLITVKGAKIPSDKPVTVTITKQ